MPNNAKHTPGEWVVVDASQVAVKLRNHNGEEYTSGIATLYSGSPIPGKSYEEGRAEMEANAALIASAPTLLQWKAEALPIFMAYDDIASEAPGRLGSSKVENLRAELVRLREANKAMHTALENIAEIEPGSKGAYGKFMAAKVMAQQAIDIVKEKV